MKLNQIATRWSVPVFNIIPQDCLILKMSVRCVQDLLTASSTVVGFAIFILYNTEKIVVVGML